MPFCDAIALAEYWAQNPPLHIMVAKYLGYEPAPQPNMMEMGRAIQVIGGRGRAAKLSTAPERDRIRFEQLKEQTKKNAKHR